MREGNDTLTGRDPRRGDLKERLEDLLLATDVSSIDLLSFYTTQDLAAMLRCDERSIERQREQRVEPPWIAYGGLARCPALFFWAWVAQQVSDRVQRFALERQT